MKRSRFIVSAKTADLANCAEFYKRERGEIPDSPENRESSAALNL
jgi:hypothetical protein